MHNLGRLRLGGQAEQGLADVDGASFAVLGHLSAAAPHLFGALARHVCSQGGAAPPNDWESVFGGPAWTRTEDGEWYLHL
ncbi:hypothetical protein, partial [Streptomyces sp. NPDC005877]|uniref:hypothetical protein n=1 Tax=Streptomyces sp. NPDC005877 TaxID=3155346 RepID=UPI00340691A4